MYGTKKVPNCQSNVEKEERSRKHHASWFQLYYKIIVIQTVWYSHKNSQWNKIERLEINPHIYDQLFITRIYDGEGTVSSISDVEKTGLPHEKEWNWTIILHHTQKLTQNGLDLVIRSETLKLLVENRGSKLIDVGLGDDFFYLTAKAKVTKAKINKWDTA